VRAQWHSEKGKVQLVLWYVWLWTTPDDLAAIFRTLKHSKQYFDKGDSVGGYKVTFLATNYVAKMGAAK